MPELPKIPDGYRWIFSAKNDTYYLFYDRHILPIFQLNLEQLGTMPEVLQELTDDAIRDWQGG